jgi:hypothetical protein
MYRPFYDIDAGNNLAASPRGSAVFAGIRKIVLLRITQRLHGSIDGMQLERFQDGLVYDVGRILAEVLLAEQWAIPVEDHDSSVVSPVTTVKQFAERERHPKHTHWSRAARRDHAIAADRSARRSKKRR